MKHLVLAGILGFSMHAAAITECAGIATDGSYVKVLMMTYGPRGEAFVGDVKIEREGNTFGYHIKAEEVSQFFEADGGAKGVTIAGLAAFVANENPVLIKYAGPNFVDMELKEIVKSEQMAKVLDSHMFVWKGPKYSSTEQYHVPKVACSVWPNI